MYSLGRGMESLGYRTKKNFYFLFGKDQFLCYSLSRKGNKVHIIRSTTMEHAMFFGIVDSIWWFVSAHPMSALVIGILGVYILCAGKK